MTRQYLLWFDILGFERKAEEIAGRTGVERRKVRCDFINTLNEKIHAAKTKGLVNAVNYGERDEWLLVLNSVEQVFRAISEILDHNTGYSVCPQIPLEMAIGEGQYDKWARFDGIHLVVEDETIQNLKSGIVPCYHELYKRFHNGESPTFTYVIFTSSFYNELEPLDRKSCQRFEYLLGRDRKLVFFAVDLNRVLQRGRLYEFLEKIRSASTKLYDRIDELYVPPIEYDDIKKTLNDKRIVFITGTAEYGKTYTTVRLLWEYFNQGYEPAWIEAGEESERREVRRRLEDIEGVLKSHSITYFEDPFGKTRYESRENLERDIGRIIDSINNIQDAFVIITSRDEVFKEFEKEHLSSVEIKDFEKRLNIKSPSYDPDRREKILSLWAESKDCKWFEQAFLRDVVLKRMKSISVLPTPLSIRDFAFATVNSLSIYELKSKIREKSRETAKSFADEIENMSDDKILLLCFPFIDRFTMDFVKKVYEQIVEELGLRQPLEFETVLEWFKDDKLIVSKGQIYFSHPSYSEALNHLLLKQGRPTRINREIFCKVLLSLAETGKGRRGICRILSAHFDELPKNTREDLLLKLVERDVRPSSLVKIIMSHYGSVGDIGNQLLLRLSEKKNCRWKLAEYLVGRPSMLLESVREDLLSSLSKTTMGRRALIRAALRHIDELSWDMRDLFFKLSKDDQVREYMIQRLVAKYDKLPQDFKDLLLSFSVKEQESFIIVQSVFEHFDKLPEDARNILERLRSQAEAAISNLAMSEKGEGRKKAILFVSKALSKLDKSFVCELLTKMSLDGSPEIREMVKELIAKLCPPSSK